MILDFTTFVETILNEKVFRVRKILSTKRHYVHTPKQALTNHNILKRKGYVRKFTTVKNKKDGTANYVHHYINKNTGDIKSMEVNGHFHPEK